MLWGETASAWCAAASRYCLRGQHLHGWFPLSSSTVTGTNKGGTKVYLRLATDLPSRCCLQECKHAFCADCVTSSARMHVAEGSVDRLTCMEPGCDIALPRQVRIRSAAAPTARYAGPDPINTHNTPMTGSHRITQRAEGAIRGFAQPWPCTQSNRTHNERIVCDLSVEHTAGRFLSGCSRRRSSRGWRS